MLRLIDQEFDLRQKASRLDPRPERVDETPVRPLPDGILREEKAFGPLYQLQQLPRRVDVPVPRLKDAIAIARRDMRRDHRVRRLADKIVEPGLRQIARDVLSKTAAGGCNPIGPLDVE